MRITEWPQHERPREKLLMKGAQALSDAELLAIFLHSGVPGKSAVDLARELLSRFGGLRHLMLASREQFCDCHGLGPARYAVLQAVLETGRRHLEQQLERGEVFSSPEAVRQYLVAQLRDYHHEVFACLFLDNRHRVIRFEEMFRGTIDGASVHPREVVKQALQYNAAAVIFAHNHPSGVCEPSRADLSLTQRLKEALALVDIRVLDHFIVGDGIVHSFAEHGQI